MAEIYRRAGATSSPILRNLYKSRISCRISTFPVLGIEKHDEIGT